MISPRHCALEIFNETVQNGSYPNLLYAERSKAYDDRDRKLITLLVTDSLSHLIHIDYILSKFIGDKKVKPIIRDILRMAIDQIVFLDFPVHAVINESVGLCTAIKKPMLKGFVNGVLRNFDRNRNIEYPNKDTLEYYSIINSKPMWLMKLWEKDYGFENAVKYSQIRNAGTAIRFRKGFDGEKWLNDKGYTFSKVNIIDNAYILESVYDLFNTDEYKNGLITIQGIGSMLACEVLSPRNDECILDACSAPGGKTINICQHMEKGIVVACELHEQRAKLVNDTLKRLNISMAKCYTKDMSVKHDEFIGKFDRVLVDAPCSGLGEINSKPDIVLKKTVDDVYTLSKLQLQILNCCADYVKDGGTLVYSTCTINKVENDNVVNKFLKEHKEFSLSNFTLSDGKTYEKGMLQLTPDVYDGFFVAKLVKNELN